VSVMLTFNLTGTHTFSAAITSATPSTQVVHNAVVVKTPWIRSNNSCRCGQYSAAWQKKGTGKGFRSRLLNPRQRQEQYGNSELTCK
jgi:hypothetical protein